MTQLPFPVPSRFYEFTNAHGEDPGHPAHGVGVLQLSDTVYDSDSISFSHRVEPFDLGGGRISVYPRQGDVWVVKDTRSHRFKMHVVRGRQCLLCAMCHLLLFLTGTGR